MMLRIVHGFAACLVLQTTVLAQELIDFKTPSGGSISQGKETNATFAYEKAPGEDSLSGLVKWEPAAEPLIYFILGKATVVPGDKPSGNIVVNVFPVDNSVTRIGVRLMDSSGQMFHWEVTPTLTPGQWQKISIPVKEGTEKVHWGGSKDGVLASPVYMQGIAFYAHRQESGGSLYIKDIGYEPDPGQSDKASAQVKQTISPQDIVHFYITPNTEAQVSFATKGFDEGAEVAYQIVDFYSADVTSGKAKVTTGGNLPITLNLPKGYYEITFPGQHGRYGICATPAHDVNHDSFFCMDSALSWLVKDMSDREQLIKTMSRAGIDMARERLYWGHVEPKPDVWSDDGGEHNGATRALYESNHVKTMELIYASPPGWTRGKDPTLSFPSDLIPATQSVMTIVHHWPGAIGALEIWNEPEGFPISNPGIYMPLLKGVSYENDATGAKKEVGGPAFAFNSKTYVQGFVDNGLTAAASFVSFHYYGDPLGLEDIVRQYRGQIGGTPLWLTESGKSWTFGPPRPPTDQDAASTRQDAMNTIESRACGVARIFPFVLPCIEFGGENFGMTGKDRTPLRSLAGYLQVIDALTGLAYIGDLNLPLDKQISRTRVFGDGDHAVMVLYGTPSASIPLPKELAGLSCEGIDGRALKVDAQGNLPFQDGLVYIRAARSDADKFLQKDTLAMTLTQKAAEASPKEPMSPIILQPGEADKNVAIQKTDYAIKRDQADHFAIQVLLNNLSDKDQTATLELDAPTDAIVTGPKEQSFSVPAKSQTTATWQAGFTKDASLFGQHLFSVRGHDANHGNISPIAFSYSITADLADYLKAGQENYRVDIFDAKKWKENHGQGGKVDISITPEGYWQMKTNFAANSARWCFPKFTLDQPIKEWTPNSLLVIRGRCTGKASVKVVLWESGKGGGMYLTNIAIFPFDGQWHTARIPYNDFSMFALAPDDDQKLSLEKVLTFSIGSTPSVGENVVEISDVYIINPTSSQAKR